MADDSVAARALLDVKQKYCAWPPGATAASDQLASPHDAREWVAAWTEALGDERGYYGWSFGPDLYGGTRAYLFHRWAVPHGGSWFLYDMGLFPNIGDGWTCKRGQVWPPPPGDPRRP